MSLIDWSSPIQVGHPKIDAQHKVIVDTINQLDMAVKAGQKRVEIANTLVFLKDHAINHFLTDQGIFHSLQQLASTDLLTNAWNRRHFLEVVEGEMHRSKRYGHPISMLLLDIDHFKRVNDTFGHHEGDRVLQEVADSVRGAMRLSDSLTRWGGEEFIVLMPNTSLLGAAMVAERIREGIAAHVFEGIGLVTASIGLAEFIPSAPRDEWLDRADRAMYRAKDGGRNRVEIDPLRGDTLSSTERLDGTFMKLVWREAYLSGNPTVDAQHEHLFHLANELLVAVISDHPEEEISNLVTGLISDVARHFEDEEAILKNLGFPGLNEHAKKHANLYAKALELEQTFRTGTLTIGNLFQFLAYEVVALHMLKADQEFFHLTTQKSAPNN